MNLCINRGMLAEAQEIASAGLTQFASEGARMFLSEWRRVLGDLYLAQGQGLADRAQREFETAIEIAEGQSARSLVLRAKMSQARMWQGQGKTGEARQMLQEEYDLFDEGFDTDDLRQARALIDQLS
jgi:predicted ATPase